MENNILNWLKNIKYTIYKKRKGVVTEDPQTEDPRTEDPQTKDPQTEDPQGQNTHRQKTHNYFLFPFYCA